MTHSPTEGAPVAVFHQQMVQDFLTIDECANKILEEIDMFAAKEGDSILDKLRGWIRCVRNAMLRLPT
jgi:hypothetical protein